MSKYQLVFIILLAIFISQSCNFSKEKNNDSTETKKIEKNTEFYIGKRFYFGIERCEGITYSDYSAVLIFGEKNQVQLVYEEKKEINAEGEAEKLVQNIYDGTFKLSNNKVEIAFVKKQIKEQYFDEQGILGDPRLLKEEKVDMKFNLKEEDCNENVAALESLELNKIFADTETVYGNWANVPYKE
jgi:hypothetical protein